MEVLPAHSLTYFIAVGSSISVPFITYFTYRCSDASALKSLAIATGVGLWGCCLFWVCRYWQPNIESPGYLWLFLVANLVLPSISVFVFKEFFVGKGLSLIWLTLPQSFRFMGGLFLLEYLRGYTGTVFSFAAGLGDIISAVIALTILIQISFGSKPGRAVFYFLVIIGSADFISAYAFSYLSTAGVPFQIFAFDELHLVTLYPLGMIPFYLVPFAMVYHLMMYLTLRRHNSSEPGNLQ